MISDGFLRPSSCRRGRWVESGYETTCYVLQHDVHGQQLFHPSVLPWHVDRRSSRLLPHYRVCKFVGGRGGGLTARRKRKSSLLCPPLFFLKVGRKKGGHNSGAVRYMYYARLRGRWRLELICACPKAKWLAV